jgi:hypothetical protein
MCVIIAFHTAIGNWFVIIVLERERVSLIQLVKLDVAYLLSTPAASTSAGCGRHVRWCLCGRAECKANSSVSMLYVHKRCVAARSTTVK